MLSGFSGLDIGERERGSMKDKIKYTDEPMGDLKVVKDFLPPPDQLVLREDRVKVTISLSKGSVEFFKKEAKKQGISYQKMIRRVIDVYTSQYQKNA
jgi:predicted DNA binding CopG/RHH family protein